MIWIALALMTVLALALPLAGYLRARRDATGPVESPDIALYRRQLARLEDEEANGMIAPEEARSARVEIERRILKADAARRAAIPAARLPAAAVLLPVALVIILAVPLYLTLGRPEAESVARRAAPQPAPEATAETRVTDLMAQLEARLADHPDEVQGWRLLGRTALGSGQAKRAAEAFRTAIDLAPESSELRSSLGEALVAMADGRVTPAAGLAFDRALRLDDANPAARYYIGLGHLQEGEEEQARDVWRALLAESPPDAPWRASLTAQLDQLDAALSGGSPQRGPSRDDIAAAEDMSPEERNAMIRSMVARLEARLEDNPGDYQGWLRLAQSRRVLGDEAGAITALERAQQAAPPGIRDEIVRRLKSLKE